MPRGRFITFEGGEGTGKSTHTRLLAAALEDRGREVVLTREPGGTPEAEKVRALLVTGDVSRWSPTAEALLNYAARDDHIRRVIAPALARGAWVISDRFHDSTRAYPGINGGADMDPIATLETCVLGETVPDLTFVLDVGSREGLSRAAGRIGAPGDPEDRFERKGEDFHRRLREAFLHIARSDPERCIVIDTTRSVEEVAASIWQGVVSRLGG